MITEFYDRKVLWLLDYVQSASLPILHSSDLYQVDSIADRY